MNPINDPCADLNAGYLLIDVLNFPDIGIGLDNRQLVSCIPPMLSRSQDLMPRLVSIEELTSTQLEQMTDIFRQQAAGEHSFAICAWLECDLKIDELAEHLSRFLYGPGPGGDKVLWRFYDPRAFAIAMSLFSQEQLVVLMGPIKSWRFTWCRHWWLVSQKFDRSAVPWDFQGGWPTDQQWPSIQRSRLINNVMNTLCAERKFTADECLKLQQASIFLLEECTRLNITEEDDQS